MMEREFARILSRYGQSVNVYDREGQKTLVRAFFQPVRDKGAEQSVPTPLGRVEQDRFLYLGPAEIPLDGRCRIVVEGESYRVETAQPIYVGETVSHWWAVLTHRAKEAMQ